MKRSELLGRLAKAVLGKGMDGKLASLNSLTHLKNYFSVINNEDLLAIASQYGINESSSKL